MARWIKSNGDEEAVHPSNGKNWTLEELQKYVDGDVEIMPGMGTLRIIMNEYAKLKNLPVNLKVSDMVTKKLQGKILRYQPVIRGNCLILEPGEKM